MRHDGNAELIGGVVVPIEPCGYFPGVCCRRILRSLEDHATHVRCGEVFMSGLVYGLPTPLVYGRQSFSPDVSYYIGLLPENRMSYVRGRPDFAVEVRSENDYGSTPDREYAEKRTDYFEAGTLVVWDVDPLNKTVTAYTATAPTTPIIFRPGETAHAEPAVPGWRLSVDALFA